MVATEARVIIPKLSPEVRRVNALRKLAVYSTLLNNTDQAPGSMAMTHEMRHKYTRNSDRLGNVLGVTSPLSLRENALSNGLRWYDSYIAAPPTELTKESKS